MPRLLRLLFNFCKRVAASSLAHENWGGWLTAILETKAFLIFLYEKKLPSKFASSLMGVKGFSHSGASSCGPCRPDGPAGPEGPEGGGGAENEATGDDDCLLPNSEDREIESTLLLLRTNSAESTKI